MAAPYNDTQIARFLFDNIASAVSAFANDGSASLISWIGPLAVFLLTVYVLMWGVGMATGQISEPFTDGMKRIIRMCIIVMFALTAGVYQSTVIELFEQAPAQMANAVTAGTEFSADFDDENDLAEMLDGSLAKGFAVAKKAYDAGEQYNSQSMVGLSGIGLTYQFLAVMLCIISVLIVGVAAGIIFVAYLALAILLALGPIFILMAIFPSLQRWFESWLGQVVNFAILFVLVASVSALLFKILGNYMDTLNAYDAPVYEVLMMCFKAVGLTIAAIAVLTQMTGIAASLAGGAQIQAANIAGKLAGAGMAGVAAGFRPHRKVGETMNDPARSNAGRAAAGVKSGFEMARRRFNKNTASQG